jgi:beta-carotene hydroxylase
MRLLAAPRFAVPTLLLLFGVLVLWIAGAAGGSTGAIAAPIAVAMCAVAAYAAFTVLHEAAHRSIARWEPLNGIAGRIATFLLMGPFPAARYFHLEHHRHTNDPTLDPDHWSGRGPAVLLPLRWATQDLHYYARFLREFRRMPRAAAAETAITLGAIAGGSIAMIAFGHGRELLLFWVLPARIAVTALAFAFDYLPHRPHDVLAADDRFRATAILPGRITGILFLEQSLHLIHHLYPGLPWYRYRQVWEAKKDELSAAGAPVRSF